MASPGKRRKLSSQPPVFWAELYAKYINNDIDIKSVLQPRVVEYITDVSNANGGTPGFFIPAIFVGINFLLSLRNAKVKVVGTYLSNLNTFVWLFSFSLYLLDPPRYWSFIQKDPCRSIRSYIRSSQRFFGFWPEMLSLRCHRITSVSLLKIFIGYGKFWVHRFLCNEMKFSQKYAFCQLYRVFFYCLGPSSSHKSLSFISSLKPFSEISLRELCISYQ